MPSLTITSSVYRALCWLYHHFMHQVLYLLLSTVRQSLFRKHPSIQPQRGTERGMQRGMQKKRKAKIRTQKKHKKMQILHFFGIFLRLDFPLFWPPFSYCIFFAFWFCLTVLGIFAWLWDRDSARMVDFYNEFVQHATEFSIGSGQPQGIWTKPKKKPWTPKKLQKKNAK